MIFSGTNCPANLASDRSFSNRSSKAAHGGQVSWPAIAKIGRPVVADVSSASSTVGSLVCADTLPMLRESNANEKTASFTIGLRRLLNRLKSKILANIGSSLSVRLTPHHSIRHGSFLQCPITAIAGEVTLHREAWGGCFCGRTVSDFDDAVCSRRVVWLFKNTEKRSFSRIC